MMAGAGLRPQFAHQIEDLRLDGDVERGGRFVGDQQLRIAGQRDCDHRALAHAARQIVRIFVEAFFRRGNFDARQQIDGPFPRLLRRQTAVADEHLGDLIADRQAGVERGHRLLEDHGQPVAAQIAHVVIGKLKQIAAVEHHRAVDLGVFRQQAHQRERRDALAAAGFADDAESGSERDGEIDLIDCMRHAAAVAVEGDAQAGNVDQRRLRSWLGCAASALAISASMLRAVGDAGRIVCGSAGSA